MMVAGMVVGKRDARYGMRDGCSGVRVFRGSGVRAHVPPVHCSILRPTAYLASRISHPASLLPLKDNEMVVPVEVVGEAERAAIFREFLHRHVVRFEPGPVLVAGEH